MKVAAYQAPLLASGSMEAIALIRAQVQSCESAGVEILCCPEAILGGLADYSADPAAFAIDADGPQLNEVLAPLASDAVTTIVGFTEIDRTGKLYNSAAIFNKGFIIGRYRKVHPAVRRSVYEPGDAAPVFTIGALTFGIIICRDSTHTEPAATMVARGARALFVPTNNGLSPAKGGSELAAQTRRSDIDRATYTGVSVIRADVAGQTLDLESHGSSGIVSHDGTVLATARPLVPDLIVAEIDSSL